MSEDQCRLIDLRERAERRLNLEEKQLPDLSPDEVRRLIYELRTLQIELELQNEELRHTQLELTESRDAYADLYDYAPVGYLTVSHSGFILRANMTVVEMLDKDRLALYKCRLSGFIVDDDQDVFYMFRHKLLENGKRQSCEVRLLNAGGNPFWARLHGSVMEMTEDKKPDLQLTITDVTERRLAEEALKKTNDELDRRVIGRTGSACY